MNFVKNAINIVRADAIAFMNDNIDCYENYDEFYDDAFISDEVCGNGSSAGHPNPFNYETLMALLLDDRYLDWDSLRDMVDLERIFGAGDSGMRYLDCTVRIGILDWLYSDLIVEFAELKGVGVEDVE